MILQFLTTKPVHSYSIPIGFRWGDHGKVWIARVECMYRLHVNFHRALAGKTRGLAVACSLCLKLYDPQGETRQESGATEPSTPQERMLRLPSRRQPSSSCSTSSWFFLCNQTADQEDLQQLSVSALHISHPLLAEHAAKSQGLRASGGAGQSESQGRRAGLSGSRPGPPPGPAACTE